MKSKRQRILMNNPLSTISNASYIIAGVLVWDIHPLLGFFCVGLGIASAGFHALRTRLWHQLDIVAICYLFGAIAGWLWLGLLGLYFSVPVGMGLHLTYWMWRPHSRVVIGILGLLCLTGHIAQNGIPDSLIVSGWFAGAFAVAYVADSEGDEYSTTYDLFHSMWHPLTATGIYYLIT